MHELSIVQNILEIACDQVAKAGAREVEEIELEIGALAGIEMEAFLFAWKAIVPDTVLANAQRHIRHIIARARCIDCQQEFEVSTFYESCPACGSIFSNLTQGRELKLKSLIVS